jgi:hypothetical protein
MLDKMLYVAGKSGKPLQLLQSVLSPFLWIGTMAAAYYNRGCYQSVIVIKISGPKTLHLKSIKNKPFTIINLSVIVIKLQIIRVHI